MLYTLGELFVCRAINKRKSQFRWRGVIVSLLSFSLSLSIFVAQVFIVYLSGSKLCSSYSGLYAAFFLYISRSIIALFHKIRFPSLSLFLTFTPEKHTLNSSWWLLVSCFLLNSHWESFLLSQVLVCLMVLVALLLPHQ